MTRPPIFRFAPSPTGHLHIGHAYSALLNSALASRLGGTFLLRIENTDMTRCTPTRQEAMLEDLRWLGLTWPTPELVQTTRFPAYKSALEKLISRGLAYPAFLSRAEIKQKVASKPDWPRDPDGTPLYPGDERTWNEVKWTAQKDKGTAFNIRLDMQKVLETITTRLEWIDTAGSVNKANPAQWGDVVLARKDTPTSYHLSVVIDDAFQEITHVVRGMDLYAATDVQCLLNHLLDLPSPIYHHHRLLLDDAGKKFSKSNKSVALRDLRKAGATPHDILAMINWDEREIDTLAAQLM